MAQRFTGESRHRLDGKGRVSIPAGYRRVLEASDAEWSSGKNPRIFIVHGLARSWGYALCLTGDAYDEVDGRIDRMKMGSKEREFMEEVYSNGTQATSIDESGRLVLSPDIRRKLALDDEVLFSARRDKFRISKPPAEDVGEGRLEAMMADLGLGPTDDPAILLPDDDPGAEAR